MGLPTKSLQKYLYESGKSILQDLRVGEFETG